MQTKLHRWAVTDPGRRFDDLFSFVQDPATLIVAFAGSAMNTGANTPGVVGLTVDPVEMTVGVQVSWTICGTRRRTDRFVLCRCVKG